MFYSPPGVSTRPNIEQITDELKTLFQNAQTKTFEPKRKSNTNFNNKPWFGPECSRSRKNYHIARNDYKNNRSAENKIKLQNSSKKYKNTINHYRNKYKHNNAKKLRTMHGKNPKQYWNFLKKLKPKTRNEESPSITEFSDFFKNINTNPHIDDENDMFLSYDFLENSNLYLDEPITDAEILKCINNLNNGKACSPSDDILNEYIKATKDLLLPIYNKLFNEVLDSGLLPKSWLEGYIIPIYKNKGNPKDTSSYRPITILSCLGKLFTSVINLRLTSYIENTELLNENQAGFRKSYSCSDHIFTLYALIEILKKKKKKLFCAFVDFSQCFDKIWRFGLWHKLTQNLIDGKLFRVIFNMYQNIKSCVSHNGNTSNFFSSEIGVRQGENLSPILFSLYLNDLQSYLEGNGAVGIELDDVFSDEIWLKLLILLYADDTVIVSDNPSDFQNILNNFNEYCDQWKLKVNLNKTKVIIFGCRNRNNYNFTLGEHNLENTDSYHYLGLTFSATGSFLKARQHISQQANKAMHLLFTKLNNADLPPDLAMKLFDNTVVPILTYGSEIFGYENLDLLEKVHSTFLRRLTYARKSTPKYMLHGELGRYPIYINVYTKMISFWTRLLLGKENKLSSKIYYYMLNQTNTNFKWTNKIKEILTQIGRPDIWLNQQFIINKNLHITVKQTLIDQYKQHWASLLQNSNKGRIYNSFKHALEYEKYFNILQKKDYITLFKFRTCNNRLPIETARWSRDNTINNICKLCNSREIGSEQHYLLNCHFFNSERNLYIPNLVETSYFFQNILSCKNEHTLMKLCKFVRIIMLKFQGMS
jgi:hypothetical protein